MISAFFNSTAETAIEFSKRYPCTEEGPCFLRVYAVGLTRLYCVNPPSMARGGKYLKAKSMEIPQMEGQSVP
jgi:hypothetical protein